MKKRYAIVIRKAEKDLLVGTVKAEAFEEAEKLANKQYAKEKQAMARGEVWLVTELLGDVKFDKEKRVINTSGNMNMYYKF